MDLKEKLLSLPNKPGIYKMLDSMGNIIYVGKAKNLKNRVSQYFRNQKGREPRVAEMIKNIHDFQYCITDTELDAFLEECRLIKELKPMYNRQLKNDGRYCFIHIPAEDFPRITVRNVKTDDNAWYFGPLINKYKAESVINYLKDFYPVRKCTTAGLVKRPNGCFYYQLGTCMGPCTGKLEPEKYRVCLDKIRQVLEGEREEAFSGLMERQEQAAERLEFEKAARYREYFVGLKHVTGKQRLVKASDRGRNILAAEFIDGSNVKFFCIKGNKLIKSWKAEMADPEAEEFRTGLALNIREAFSIKEKRQPGLDQYEIDEAQIIYSYIRKNRKQLSAFWIPSSRISGDDSGLNAVIDKIVRVCKNRG